MFRQPRVPEMRDGQNIWLYLKELVRFLKDFTMSCWTAHQQNEKEIKKLREEIDAMKNA